MINPETIIYHSLQLQQLNLYQNVSHDKNAVSHVGDLFVKFKRRKSVVVETTQ